MYRKQIFITLHATLHAVIVILKHPVVAVGDVE